MRVGPAYPRWDTALRIVHDDKRRDRNGPAYLDPGNGHQAKVPATTETRGRRHYLLELTMALVERVNSRDCDQ